MSAETRWWWIRHAPAGSAEGLILGQLDTPIDPLDNGAVQALAARLPMDAVWLSSGLLRTVQTARALGTGEPVSVAGLNEQNFGAWQGRRWADLTDAETLSFWQDYAANAPPEGESFARMAERVGDEIGSLNQAHQGRDIVAVAHAGTIRAALGLALELKPKSALSLAIDPLSLSRIDGISRPGGMDWRVLGVNLR